MRTSLPAIVLGLFIVTPPLPAAADLLGLVVENDPLGLDGEPLPEGIVVFNVYAAFDDPADQCVGVFGAPDIPFHVTVSGGVFFDSDHFLAGDLPPDSDAVDLPGFEELNWDSWFTVGNRFLDVGPAWPSGAPFVNDLIYGPGTTFDAGGETVWTGGPGSKTVWTVPAIQDDPGDGTPGTPTPQSLAGNWPDDRVLILRVAVTASGDPAEVSLSMACGLPIVVGGESSVVLVSTSEPCAGDADGDGDVGVLDIVAVNLAWGNDCADPCPADFDGDGIVGVADLINVILNWGPCD